MSCYKVHDYEGNDKYFHLYIDAKKYKKMRRIELHNKYCIEKHAPSDKCLCTISNNQQECAAHSYARTVTDHELSACILREDVYIEDIDIE